MVIVVATDERDSRREDGDEMVDCVMETGELFYFYKHSCG
jgi:hypothetical protein